MAFHTQFSIVNTGSLKDGGKHLQSEIFKVRQELSKVEADLISQFPKEWGQAQYGSNSATGSQTKQTKMLDFIPKGKPFPLTYKICKLIVLLFPPNLANVHNSAWETYRNNIGAASEAAASMNHLWANPGSNNLYGGRMNVFRREEASRIIQERLKGIDVSMKTMPAEADEEVWETVFPGKESKACQSLLLFRKIPEA